MEPTTSKPHGNRIAGCSASSLMGRIWAPVVRTRALTAILAALCALALAQPVPAQVPDGVDWETTQVARDIHQFRWGGHNALLISTPAGMVVVDPISPAAGPRMADEIRRLTPNRPLQAIVYSHSDHDHAAGAPALVAAMGQTMAEVEIVAHEAAVPHIVALNDPDLPPPTITFAQRMAFQVGGRTVELHYLGPSHTDNLIVPFIPDVGVAFAVDFVFNDRVGWRDLPGWHFPGLFHAIAGLLEIPFRTMVFGHGQPGDRGTIQRQLTYYDDLASAVRSAVEEGWTEDQAAARILLPEYSHWDDYDEWLSLNVRALYRWLDEQSPGTSLRSPETFLPSASQ